MEAFGIRFAVTDKANFVSLAALFDRLRADKTAGIAGTPELWKTLFPNDVKTHFGPPDDAARRMRITDLPPVIIGDPSDQLGATWDFYRVFEAIEEGDYDLLACKMVTADTAEIHINPHGYPYGGVGPFIALAEAYGYRILGVNEYGKYQNREELVREGSEPTKAKKAPWWKFW